MTRALPGLAAGVTLGTVPFVALKISWLAGGDVGLRDPALMRTTTYVVANSITLVLDLIVVALAWVLASLRGGGCSLFLPRWSGVRRG